MDPSLNLRFAALESQVRRWKLVTVLLALTIMVLLLVAAGPQMKERGSDDGFVIQGAMSMLRSQSFVVVGSDGKVYARLTTTDDKPVLNFYDSKGHVVWSAPPNNGMQPVGAQEMKK